MGIDIINILNDCRISRLIGLVRLGQKAEMEVEHVGTVGRG